VSIPRLGPQPTLFPPASSADEDGLVAWGGDLRPERLVAAYSRGIFPWPHDGMPLLWFSPDPRMVLPLRPDPTSSPDANAPPGEAPGEAPPARFGPRVSRRLARTLRQGRFEMRLDSAFSEVIAACADTPRAYESGTWITPAMQRAYIRLHELGVAHCAEAWLDGRLVGGIYGLALGGVFCGESMFHRERDASKAALVTLARQLAAWDFDLFDAQLPTAHLSSLGFQPWPRARYLRRLERSLQRPTRVGPWRLEIDPKA